MAHRTIISELSRANLVLERRHVDIDTSDPEDRGAARRTMSHWIEETLEEGLRVYYNVERSLDTSVTKFQHVELVSAPHCTRSVARAPPVLERTGARGRRRTSRRSGAHSSLMASSSPAR